MRAQSILRFSCLIIFSLQAAGRLLVDYTAPASVDELGDCQLEHRSLGDHGECPGDAAAFIKPGTDPQGKKALHLHRNADWRRAEIKAKGSYQAGKKYYVGYNFQLSGIHEHLAIFQWKKEDKSTGQNIPFNLQFSETDHTRLTIGYTPASGDYKTIWTSKTDFKINTPHSIALAWDTMEGSNSLAMWFDGNQVFQTHGLDLWTGPIYPKFGIYRGEKGDHDGGSNSNNNIFDSYIYRVQVSDTSLDEVSAAGGLHSGQGSAPDDEPSSTTPATAAPTNTFLTKTRPRPVPLATPK